MNSRRIQDSEYPNIAWKINNSNILIWRENVSVNQIKSYGLRWANTPKYVERLICYFWCFDMVSVYYYDYIFTTELSWWSCIQTIFSKSFETNKETNKCYGLWILLHQALQIIIINEKQIHSKSQYWMLYQKEAYDSDAMQFDLNRIDK